MSANNYLKIVPSVFGGGHLSKTRIFPFDDHERAECERVIALADAACSELRARYGVSVYLARAIWRAVPRAASATMQSIPLVGDWPPDQLIYEAN